METVAFCEVDEKCRQVLSKHWPGVPQYTDVRTLTGVQLERDGITDIGLICGGFPCQPFSVAGKRGGKADDRDLWPEMFRLVQEVKPAWVIGENVAGILSMEFECSEFRVDSKILSRYPDFDLLETVLTRQEIMLLDSICKDLESAGYEVQPFVIPASAVGAFHRRYRVWIVAHYDSEREKQPQCEFRRSVKTVASEYGERESMADAESQRCGKAGANSQRSEKRIASSSSLSHTFSGQRPLRRDNSGMGRKEQSSTQDAPNSDSQGLQIREGEDAGGTGQNSRSEFERDISGSAESRLGRAPHGVSSWLDGSWEEGILRVTTNSPGRVNRLKQLGNAVVPQVVEVLGRAIMEAA